MTAEHREIDESRRLSELIRAADPAAGTDGPTPAETDAARERVLEAAVANGSTRPLRWAAAAAVAALCVAGAWFWAEHRTGERTPPPVRLVATTPIPPAETNREETRAPDTEGETEAAELGGTTSSVGNAARIDSHEADPTADDPSGSHEGTTETARAEIADATAVTSPPDRIATREIRFETERGTRIVWIFQDDIDHETTQGAVS